MNNANNTVDDFKPGTQIIYVPNHADGDINHPGCEEGFVTSTKTIDDDVLLVFCRFWSKHHDGIRTLANSEACFACDLVIKDTHNQKRVDDFMDKHYGKEW